METTYPNCTMSYSKAFRASLTDYDLVMEVVKDTYFKLYILAAGIETLPKWQKNDLVSGDHGQAGSWRGQ